MAELALGRRTGRNPIDAFQKLDPSGRWALVGAMSVVASLLVLSYYSVIAGWVLAYTVKALRSEFAGLDAAMLRQSFAAFAGHGASTVAWHGAFMACTFAVVVGGVSGGIERWAKILMPGLVLFMVALAVRVLTLDGARAGAAWLLIPQWDRVSWSAMLQAMGQVFFSFSLGMGVMITYGSYLGRGEDIPRSAALVAGADASIALLSGLIVISALFAFGLPVDGGPGLMFITLPAVLGTLPLGALITFVFFAMVTMAALTSSVALLEVVVASAGQRWSMPRRRATIAAALVAFGLGVPSALSHGAGGMRLLGRDVLGIVDGVTSQVLLPLGGLLTAIFVAWVWGMDPARAELSEGSPGFRAGGLWSVSMRVIVPLVIALVLTTGLLGMR
jgi:NSS family neurotransmitter:Na+ symporter